MCYNEIFGLKYARCQLMKTGNILSNYAQIRKNQRAIESDRNSEILDLDVQFSKIKPERIEMINLKNNACQRGI